MKKTKTKKEPAPVPVRVDLVSYSIKAIIPTGAYANIQPEITVYSESIEHARDFVLPHIEALFTKYLNYTERPPQPMTDSTITSTSTYGGPTISTTTTTISEMSESYNRAYSAITNAMSDDALEIIEKQIDKSVKLTEIEKAKLIVIVLKKREINNKPKE